MNTKILIIEDEIAIADTIIYPLKTEQMEAFHVQSLTEGKKALDEELFNLVILDVGLPDGNGFEFLKDLRKWSSIPVIILTARKEEIDRIVGLEIGADDYVVKPFSPRELVSRVKAILRRVQLSSKNKDDQEKEIIPLFVIDEKTRTLKVKGIAVELTKIEFNIIHSLIKRPGWVFSREKLIDMVSDEPLSCLDRTIDAHIKSIRKKIKFVDEELNPIKTHRGVGYSFQDQK